MKKQPQPERIHGNLFERFALRVSRIAGSTPAFLIALGVILVWLVTGPLFGFSETWQLMINTGTTIITFLMVFLIQKAQNKDALAIQLKLNELLAAADYASNRLVNVEDMTEEELLVIQKYYSRLRELAKKDRDLLSSHSIDEARERHREKRESHQKDVHSRGHSNHSNHSSHAKKHPDEKS